MTKKLTYLLLIALTILIGTYLYHKFCCCNCCQKEVATETSTLTSNDVNQSFMIEDGNFSVKCLDNFKFLNNQSDVIIPISDSLSVELDKIKMYLNDNPTKKLNITGFAKESEVNESMFPNLGFARANSLKNLLVSKGFDASRFELDGKIEKDWNTSGDTLLGPNNFKLFTLDNSEQSKTEDFAALKESINASPLVLYFNTNQTQVNLTAEERAKVASIVKYLDNVPDATLQVEGHTDNVGDRTANVNLGLKRANFIKDYLSKNGIDAAKINTTSKGPDTPIASNDTADGKSKNRRSIITIN